ncbi:hypothetical protein EMCRGX_G033224 [Ephydatia muelleri]
MATLVDQAVHGGGSSHSCLSTMKVSTDISKYYRSFVGRDFKAFVQIALFGLSPSLTASVTKVWLALSKQSPSRDIARSFAIQESIRFYFLEVFTSHQIGVVKILCSYIILLKCSSIRMEMFLRVTSLFTNKEL